MREKKASLRIKEKGRPPSFKGHGVQGLEHSTTSQEASILCNFAPDGTVTYVNDSFCNFFSGKRESFLGRSVGSWIPPCSSDFFEEHSILLHSLPGQASAQVFHHDVKNSIGELRSLEWIVVPVLDKAWNIAMFSAVGRDVTSQMRLVKIHKGHNPMELFHEIVNHIKEVLWVSSGEKTLYVSPACEEMWGVSREVLYGNPEYFLNVVHHEDRERIATAFEKGKADGYFDEEYRIIRPDGTIRWVNARSIPASQAARGQLSIGIAVDITDYKTLEASLNDENSFRRAVIEIAPFGICVCHEIGEYPYVRFTVWNELMASITGYTMEEINDRGWFQTQYPGEEGEARARERKDRMWQGDNLCEEEMEITRPDGGKRTVAVSTSLLFTREGMPHAVALFHDITAKRNEERQLLLALNELENKTNELTEKNQEIERSNAALKILLKRRDDDREEMRQSILSNLRHLVLPYLEKAKDPHLSYNQVKHYCDVIERNINELASSFVWELSNKYLNLTPMEMRTAELLKRGRSTKEIAEELGVALSTVNSHREALRRKLGLTGKRMNLSTYIRMLK